MLEDFSSMESTGLLAADVSPYSFAETDATRRRPRTGRVPATLFQYRVIKRAVDLAAVVLALPVLLPLFFLLACIVRLTSPGPIFYSHRRIRQNGAFFSMWKFRTMCVNSAEVLEEYLSRHPEALQEWNRCHKLRHDPRITRVGNFLRRYSLDEVPQLWNVITGEMSLVGPRPIVAAEVDKYKEAFGAYCRVKPGLTGLWQVSGRCTLSYDQRVALDRRYVQGWTLAGDLKILLRTLPSVITQDGAF
ncbi:MAG: sugar transferase [Acidobacteriota bacterium]|nr:sugar transferase [Acidobacteriota bacterium]